MANKAKETAGSEQTTSMPAVPLDSASLVPALYADAGAFAQFREQGFSQVSLPPIVKPRLMPVGAFFVGVLTGIMDSPIKEYKNRILQFTRSQDGYRFCFPMTAVISKALGATDAEQDKQIGNEVLIKKTGTQKSKKGKKDTALFEVYIKNAAKKK